MFIKKSGAKIKKQQKPELRKIRAKVDKLWESWEKTNELNKSWSKTEEL